MVPADSDRISRVPPYSGYHYPIKTYVYGIVTLYDRSFQNVPLRRYIHVVVLQPRRCLNSAGLG